MIQKSPLVRALKQVLKEYKEGTHTLEMSSCALCKLYRKDWSCTECPMKLAFFRCGSRYCAPVNCGVHASTKRTKGFKNRLNAVCEFYQRTIARVRRMTISELNALRAFDFLIKIDREVAEKYQVKKYFDR